MTPTSRSRLLSRALLAATVSVGALVPSVTLAQGMPPMPPPGELFKFDDVVKGMTATPGLITFYRQDPNDPAKDHTRLLAVFPKALLKQDLLMANSVSRGPNYGFPLDSGVLVRFEQQGNRLLLVAPDSRFKDDADNVINDAVRDTYRPRILAGFPVLSVDPSGGLLVDLSPGVYSGMGAVSTPGVRRDLSRITKLKSFPENVLIDVDLAVGSANPMAGGGAVQTIGLSYAFRRLPALGSYTPRVADERVGYFTTVRQDWTVRYSERENILRYVNRWNLKKKDPSLDLSPPEKPVTFIIEKTVPVQFRKYVAEGIAVWNEAFEKVGITGAIVVQQQTDDNEFKDIDPEDARYNFVRWIVTGDGFAMGPSRPDPRTGQLLDADIIFDDSMARYASESVDVFGPKAFTGVYGDAILDFFRENPAFLPAGVELPQADRELLKPDTSELLKDIPGAEGLTGVSKLTNPRRFLDGQQRHCTIGTGVRHQIAMLRLAAAASGAKKLPDRLVGEYIRDVTAHEVGHTIGLRHNFKGSAWLTVDEIKKRRDTTDDALWSSVMDYNPMLFFPGDKIEEVRHVVSPTIGPYDFWAIEYGYSTPEKGKSEAEHLAAIASKTNTRELAYATDEDVMGFTSPDPRANRFDMSADPVAWAKMRAELSTSLLATIKDWGAKKDEPNHFLRDAFMTVMWERARNLPYAARAVTGQLQSRSRRGDPDAPAPFTLMNPKDQRDALKFVTESAFADGFFEVDPELFNQLGASRNWDWASGMPASRTDFPVHSAILSMQAGTLSALTNAAALQRVYDAERKTKADDKFTAAELLTTVRDAVWSELDKVNGGRFTDAKPGISSLRRNLQQQYLQNTLSLAELRSGQPLSPDLQNMLRFSLRELSGKLGKTLEGKDRLDFATRAHLTEAKTRIDRVLDAPFVPGGGGGGQIILIMGQTPDGTAPSSNTGPDRTDR